MSEELLYTVTQTTVTPAERIGLAEARLFERQHLQEWILAHPEMLGEEALVVTFEFDRWITSAGAPAAERLDVLALDREGRLIVAELKRGTAPDAVVVQALNYAALASRFTLDLLAEAYAARTGRQLTAPELLDELRDWAPALSDDTLSPPRIVILAEEFGPILRNTAMFLIEQGLDLRLVRVQLYRLANDTLALTASQLLPVPDTEEFMVRPRSAATTQRAVRAAAARRSAVAARLVRAGVFDEGEELTLIVPPSVGEHRDAIERWLAADPQRGRAFWRQDASEPVVWAVDGKPWSLTGLVRHIISEGTGETPRTQVWGPNWFVNAQGEVLHELAEAVEVAGGAFDWAPLHRLLAALPAGRWTTYGDLARLIGTAPQPVGQHIMHCERCPNPWRVLGVDGKQRPNFSWSDPADARTQRQALEAEGVQFNQSGGAAVHQRLRSEELAALVDGSVPNALT